MTDSSINGLSTFAVGLREARLARSFSLADVAKAMLLSDTQIAGLEADDYRAFYNASFAERAARRYAEYLGVNIALPEALQGNAAVQPLQEDPPTLKPLNLAPVGAHRPGFALTPRLLRGVVAVLGIVAVGLVAWQLRGRGASVPVAPPEPVAVTPPIEQPPVAAAAVEASVTPAPSGTEPVAAPPAPQATPTSLPPVADDFDHRFFLVVTRDVRIQASDSRGVALLSGLQPPSMGQRIVGEPPFSIAVSDEDAVEIYYRGQRIRPGPTVYDGIEVTVVR